MENLKKHELTRTPGLTKKIFLLDYMRAPGEAPAVPEAAVPVSRQRVARVGSTMRRDFGFSLGRHTADRANLVPDSLGLGR